MRIFFATVLACVLMLAVPVAPASSAACSEIVIGAALSLTGRYSTGGVHTRNGYEFAVQQIKKSGGIKVGDRCHHFRVIYHDVESKPQRAVELTRHLIEKGQVRFLLGPFNSVIADAVVPIANARKVPILTAQGISQSLQAEQHGYLFGLHTSSDEHFALAIDLARKRATDANRDPGSLKVVIGMDADPRSRVLASGAEDRLNRAGMKVAFKTPIGEQTDVLNAFVNRLGRLQPDVLLLATHSLTLRRIVDTMYRKSLNVPMVVGTRCIAARLVERMRDAAQNIFCVGRRAQSLDQTASVFANAAKFERAYRTYARWPETKPVPDATGHAAMAVYVLAKAVEQARSRVTEKVLAALREIDVMTVYGRVTFDGRPRQSGERFVLRQIQGSKYNIIAPDDLATHGIMMPRSGL